jgi:putative hemolysin
VNAVDKVNRIDLRTTLPAAHAPGAPPPFSAGAWFEGSAAGALLAPLGPIVDRALALPALAALYGALPQDGRPFWDRALEALDTRYEIDGSLDDIPAAGPLVVVANHPYGGLDGLILGSLLARVRGDARLLVNRVLGRVPEVRRSSFLVDPFGRAASTAVNAAALRAAMRWLRDGGALATFPAGEVAHVRATHGGMVDSPWSPAVVRLAERASATVVPVFFEGGNSRLFTAAGLVHPRARTALLVRELLKQRGATITVRVGRPISPLRLRAIGSTQAATAFLRLRTDALAADVQPRSTPGVDRAPAPIADPEPSDAIRQELTALGSSSVLAASGVLQVVVADAAAIPRSLREIGRLREIAFRAAGEGSGMARDVDRFDAHYAHLVVWNPSAGEIVGAYRVGQTDRIVDRLGVDGLYTRSLFRFDERLLAGLGPALELGRAFVRPEYQRDYSPLLLLWKGIGAYVVRNPRYRWLFGTVSISADYRSLSRQLMVSFLYATSVRPDLARLVQPTNPPAFLRSGRAMPAALGSVVRTLADVGALVAEIEADGKGVPVLLRQYLKLNAKLLGFNVDDAFGGVLDGLMAVDLMALAPELRTRYMGREGSEAFAAYHACDPRPALQNCASHT